MNPTVNEKLSDEELEEIALATSAEMVFMESRAS
jgi:hypothetical protein